MRGLGRVFNRGSINWIAYYHRGRSIAKARAQRMRKRRAGCQRSGDIGTGRFSGVREDRIGFEDLASALTTDYEGGCVAQSTGDGIFALFVCCATAARRVARTTRVNYQRSTNADRMRRIRPAMSASSFDKGFVFRGLFGAPSETRTPDPLIKSQFLAVHRETPPRPLISEIAHKISIFRNGYSGDLPSHP